MKFLSSWNPDCDRVNTAPPIITIRAENTKDFFNINQQHVNMHFQCRIQGSARDAPSVHFRYFHALSSKKIAN